MYTFGIRLAVGRQFLDGEASLPELARMRHVSSPKLLGKWVQAYRIHGEDALRLKAKGRPKSARSGLSAEVSELENLRLENQRLQAENAYVKKYEP